ncbi:Ankyrin repeat protein [Mycena chlorophos]|uniref:Ankyrin repeat protein n=1 Tax=Mycena chlorophos TaxID=658473 RepID=A0A8H6W5G4_MYCCL|nr:Ankyrin repeat protein [Mycena chlorophos]
MILSLPAELHVQIAAFLLPDARAINSLSLTCSVLHANTDWLLYEACRVDKSWRQHAIAVALSRSNETLLDRLAAAKVPLNEPMHELSSARPLHRAAYSGQLGHVRRLLEIYGEDAASEAYAGLETMSPLHAAAMQQHWDVVLLLARLAIDGSTSQDIDNRKEYLADGLCCAAGDGNLDIMRIFLEEFGADVNYSKPLVLHHRCKTTALFAAVASEHIPAIELLLEAGADPNAFSTPDNIPLHQAFLRRNYEIVGMLLDAGADGSLQDGSGRTALHRLIPPGSGHTLNLPLIRRLLESGTDVGALDGANQTVLHYACLGSPGVPRPVVELLIEYGADVDVRCQHGRTPVDRAMEAGRTSLVKEVLFPCIEDPAHRMRVRQWIAKQERATKK